MSGYGQERAVGRPRRDWAVRGQRRGSIYLLTLGLGSILTIIGVGVIATSRAGMRSVSQAEDWAEAQSLTYSAVEHAIVEINSHSNWRNDFNGTTTQCSLGRGSFTWRLVDEGDGSMTDDPHDACTAYVTGTVGRATYSMKVHLAMAPGPLPALKMALATGGNTTVTNYDSATFTGGPLGCNKTVTINYNATVTGIVQAKYLSIISPGALNGSSVVPSPAMTMPDSTVFSQYRGRATTLNYNWFWYGSMDDVNLSPSSNPQGAPNADGVYYINTGNRDLYIDHCNIQGTLVIDCGTATVTLGAGTKINSYRTNYPALIVKGDLKMTFSTGGSPRPWGTHRRGGGFRDNGHHWGWFNFLQYWTEPGEIVGLVHVKGNLAMQSSSGVEGCVICEGDVWLQGTHEFANDPVLWQTPPVGYTTGPPRPCPDFWGRVVQ